MALDCEALEALAIEVGRDSREARDGSITARQRRVQSGRRVVTHHQPAVLEGSGLQGILTRPDPGDGLLRVIGVFGVLDGCQPDGFQEFLPAGFGLPLLHVGDCVRLSGAHLLSVDIYGGVGGQDLVGRGEGLHQAGE